jgi:hypothetical protein
MYIAKIPDWFDCGSKGAVGPATEVICERLSKQIVFNVLEAMHQTGKVIRSSENRGGETALNPTGMKKCAKPCPHNP